MKGNPTIPLETKLEAWAAWRVKQDSGVLMTVRAVTFQYTTSGVPGPTLPLDEDEDDMMAINDLIFTLPEVLCATVVTEWLYGGTQEMKARHHQVTRLTYRSRLAQAYAELLAAGL